MIIAALAVLAAAGACFVFRVICGPTLGDRVVAVDGLILTIVAAIVVDAARRGSGLFLDVAVVVALVGFVGTAAAARFIEQRGS